MRKSLGAETPGGEKGATLLSGLRVTVGADFFSLPRAYRVLWSQTPLTVTTLIVVVFLLVIDPALVKNELFSLGVAGVFLLTGAAALLRWSRLPHWCMWLVPLADFIPIGAMVHGTNSTLNGVSLLSVFPVLWLAWSDIPPLVTRMVAFFAPLAIAWAPFIFATTEPTRSGLIKPLLIPLIMMALAIAATIVTRSLTVQAQRLTETSTIAHRRAWHLDTIINVAEVGVVVVDEEGRDVLMNTRQRTFHSLAVPPGKLNPTEAELLVFGSDRTTAVEPAKRPVRRAVDGAEFSGELYWLGRGVNQRAMSTSARQIIDDRGNNQGAVVVFHDVTEVMEAVAAQEDFVASVSHELRTPLTSILGYLELVMDEEKDEATAGYLKVISRNAERLLTLVSDLLDSTRDAMAVSLVPGDAYPLLISAVDAARPRAAERGITLRLDAEEGLLGSFDGGRISQAIDNLISNAIKFSPTSSVVDVVGRNEDSGVVVLVRDYGVGMNDDEQARLFTRFYRTDSARSAAVPGVGLGLAITKDIVDAHGGTLIAQSQTGKGSTFTLRIPALITP
ncbi:sensor histidine kinase [Arthrobacter antibioticus]|uniref:sensor histidine kinase n=1 Tax=Arthrobacter sp. H35-MC1 TaxID=3046203 RepID=UPI0024BA2E52|nr:HAMP domain-containing sensor histidine kinase [Arthrobacter sp. H35-MC1]MDJ0317128.1 HAMP domain-containing sensor histidine kinase [Arthrobacter sp. H35-MC1]